jgi:subtilisin family serine protease
MWMGRRFWSVAIAVLLATEAGAARLAATTGAAKLDTQLRPRVALKAPTRLVPLTPHGSKARVFVRVASAEADDLTQLRRAGLRIDRVVARHNLVRGRIRRKDLPRLASLDVVRSIEPVRRGHLRAGSIVTEGDAASRAPQARAVGFDGTGITVGVISDGIERVDFSIATGDLPAGTGLPPSPSPTCANGDGDEGTAMLEIVHDVAPGATLRFSEGISDKLAFIDSIDCLRDAGAQVIVDDIAFLDEPFFEDGIIGEAVRDAVAAGVSFHSAAGNAGEIHYSATFSPEETPEGTYHVFAAGPDLFDRIDLPPGRTLVCVLQWDDRFGLSANDYDLELWELSGPPALIDASANFQTGTQNPFESVGAHNPTSETIRVGVRVRREDGDDRLLKLVCLGAENLQYRTPAGSIFGHPSLPEVVASGAMDATDFGLNDMEPFSSQGPVEIFFPNRDTRDKPDLVAFDGVATSVCPSAALCFDPFFGTSAAAPHTAAVAALLLQKNSCLAPAEVLAKLTAGAVDILLPGFDDVSGAGRLDAFNVLTAPDACDDGNACTRDTCTLATGCLNTPLADGEACPDGDLCNGNETCAAGACAAGTPLVCNDGSACTTDACSASAGCVFQNTCDDDDPCTTDTCDGLTGCGHAPAPEGTPCPDADLCNGGELCQAGVCTPGAPLVCADGPACSTGVCDATRGCQYPPIEGLDGVTCLCAAGLGSAGCVAPGGAVTRFQRACDLVARATGAKRRRARGLLAAAGQKLGKASRQVRRAGKRSIAPDCANALEASLDDVLARTLAARSRL